jgi:hypothetical protein
MLKSPIEIKGIWKIQVGDTLPVYVDNITPDVALEALAMQMADSSSVTYTFGENPYIAIGDVGTTPSAGDTTLGNETQRKAVSVITRVAGEVEFSVFFNAGEATGVHREFGFFCSGANTQATSSLDSGILGSRITQTTSVGASETLTLSFIITYRRP